MKVPMEIQKAFRHAMKDNENRGQSGKWAYVNWDWVSANIYMDVDQEKYDIPLQDYIDYLINRETRDYDYVTPNPVYLFKSEGKPAI